VLGHARLPLAGAHNRANAAAAIAAAAHVGVVPQAALAALAGFRGIARRLELRGTVAGIEVYDDFAHHPTAIAATVAALRERPGGRVIAVLEPRSNTMRLGGHAQTLAESLNDADLCFVYARPDLRWDAAAALQPLGSRLHVHAQLDALVADVVARAQAGDRILAMSNGDFGGVHQLLLTALAQRASAR
jgi:UDP-N-acetylmuramate: L-alanyl-gamma-D-glutamyl-meso-diaminopimelate ligase